MNDFLFTKERIFKHSPMRGLYFLMGGLFFVLTEVGRNVYRPYIYQNSIPDYGLADVVGNLLGTVTIIFMELGIIHANHAQARRITFFVTLGVALYELSQHILPRGVMDWKDLYATLIAGVFTYLLVIFIWKKAQPPKFDIVE